MKPGQRLYPGQNATGADGSVLRFQEDGNLVLYVAGVPVWASGTFNVPGFLEMQGDGNLVIYDAATIPIWASGSHAPGASLTIARAGLSIVVRTFVEAVAWQAPAADAPVDPPPVPGPGAVRPLVGLVGVQGRSFRDASGPRLVHGCSDFGAIAKFHEDPDRMRRQLDVVAAHQQYVRVLWRLNGSLWAESGITNDPIRDSWFDEALRGYLQACHDRGIRVNLSSGDFYSWTHQQSLECFRRVGQIAASVSNELVWLSAATNEMRGTMPGGESDENVRWMSECLRAFAEVYPWALLAGSDPASQDKAGMQRLAPSPANVALIHNVRWGAADAIRRAFNAPYENAPDLPIVEDEGTGPENPAPAGPFNRKVYQPTENRDDLCALYTQQVIAGSASTYFNDPALYSRRPLEETWGFKELPALWRLMDIPEDIGQGRLVPGHKVDAPLRVVGSNAHRADSTVLGGYAIGVISGGSNWRVTVGRAGQATVYQADGAVWSGAVSVGQELPIHGPAPAIVRILS